MTPVLTHASPAFRDNLPSPSQKILPSPSLMHPQPRSPSPASPQPTLSPVLFSVFQLSQLMHQGFQFCLSGWLGTSQVTNPEGSPAPPQRTRPEQHSLLASLALRPDARRQASPDALLLQLFHLLSTSNHPVDDLLLLICQLFLLPPSVCLTTGVNRPSRLEPERQYRKV